MRRRTSVDCSKTSKPSTRTVPEVAGMKPVMIRMVVVFPAPLGPRKPRICPSAAVNETSRIAARSPYRLLRFATSIIGSISTVTGGGNSTGVSSGDGLRLQDPPPRPMWSGVDGGRALVTGGSGYFGSLLLRRLLERGWACRVFDLNDADDRPASVEFVRGDVRDEAALGVAWEGIDVIFHN